MSNKGIPTNNRTSNQEAIGLIVAAILAFSCCGLPLLVSVLTAIGLSSVSGGFFGLILALAIGFFIVRIVRLRRVRCSCDTESLSGLNKKAKV